MTRRRAATIALKAHALASAVFLVAIAGSPPAWLGGLVAVGWLSTLIVAVGCWGWQAANDAADGRARSRPAGRSLMEHGHPSTGPGGPARDGSDPGGRHP